MSSNDLMLLVENYKKKLKEETKANNVATTNLGSSNTLEELVAKRKSELKAERQAADSTKRNSEERVSLKNDCSELNITRTSEQAYIDAVWMSWGLM